MSVQRRALKLLLGLGGATFFSPQFFDVAARCSSPDLGRIWTCNCSTPDPGHIILISLGYRFFAPHFAYSPTPDPPRAYRSWYVFVHVYVLHPTYYVYIYIYIYIDVHVYYSQSYMHTSWRALWNQSRSNAALSLAWAACMVLLDTPCHKHKNDIETMI